MNAVYGIANAGVHRRRTMWGEVTTRLTLPLYVLASSCAGATTGAVLGAVGSLIPPTTRISIATGLTLIAVIAGERVVLGRFTRSLQCNQESPRTWVELVPARWAVRN